MPTTMATACRTARTSIGFRTSSQAFRMLRSSHPGDAEALLLKGKTKPPLDKLTTLRSRIDGCGAVSHEATAERVTLRRRAAVARGTPRVRPHRLRLVAEAAEAAAVAGVARVRRCRR